jgi:hypothetical protein
MFPRSPKNSMLPGGAQTPGFPTRTSRVKIAGSYAPYTPVNKLGRGGWKDVPGHTVTGRPGTAVKLPNCGAYPLDTHASVRNTYVYTTPGLYL